MNVQRALIAQIASRFAPAKVAVLAANSRRWSSTTFNGERHELSLLIEGDAAPERVGVFQREIDCADFNIQGNLVADIMVHPIDPGGPVARLTVEALTVATA